jgi:hypothetical protein
MKTAFDFQSSRVTGGEKMALNTQILPGTIEFRAEKAGFLPNRLADGRSFSTTYNICAEKLTMAQPLLGGQMR